MITDMMDMGHDLGDLIAQAAEIGVNVSVIGVGIDFNADLAEQVLKTEGANYFAVTQEKQLEEIIVENFHYNFFPCAYNVLLSVSSEDYEVVRTYGSPFDPV